MFSVTEATKPEIIKIYLYTYKTCTAVTFLWYSEINLPNNLLQQILKSDLIPFCTAQYANSDTEMYNGITAENNDLIFKFMEAVGSRNWASHSTE
jgi:hypothetical protein